MQFALQEIAFFSYNTRSVNVSDESPFYMVDGLFLFGYVNENLRDTILWQTSGAPSMVCEENLYLLEVKPYV